MTNSLFSQLRDAFPEIEWESQASLAPYTYMKVGGPAEVLWVVRDLELLKTVLQYVFTHSVPVTILGGASNVVVADAGVSGLVIINACDQVQHLKDVELSPLLPEGLVEQWLQQFTGKTLFLSETGIKTALLVRWSVDQGLSGLEPFLGVPGTLGGAIFNNSHYTQELIGAYVVAVEVVTPTGEVQWLSQEECDFAYDHSRFHTSKEIICRVIFALESGDKDSSLAKIREATEKRAKTQPLGTANSGCMFRNVLLPVEKRDEYGGQENLSAGWLIDQAGLKGKRVGGAFVSDKHANFLVNDGTASARDVDQLAREIEEIIQEKYGVQLEREVFFLGKHE